MRSDSAPTPAEPASRALADGTRMPLLGLGVWQIPDGAETERAVAAALEAGYRLIDTAQAYGNEAGVGRAIAAAGLPPGEVFVTTKFLPWSKDPLAEAERSRERLGIERIDLYLVHFPRGGATWAWPGMQRALERGIARAIGVSNFGARHLRELLGVADVKPVVNQVQFSPLQYRRGLLEACERAGIALEAYSPLTRGRELEHPVIAEIASRHKRTPAQVMLRWVVQRGLIVIPKSRRPERIRENARIFDFALAEGEMARLDALDRTGNADRALEREWWTPMGRARAVAGRVAGAIRDR